MRAVLIALLVAASMPARADVPGDLAEARRLEAALDYAGGLRILDQALARGGADEAHFVELHLLAGKLAAGLDRTQEAEAHFARVLALRPQLALPDGTSPKITAPFDAARARAAPLRITVRVVGGLVTLVPDADPLGLVGGISVHVVDEHGGHADVVDRRATRIAIPAGTTATEVTALDPNGHRIWTGTSPHVAPVAIEPRIPQPEERSWIARWPTWATVGGLALVTGGIGVWRVKVAQDEWDRLRADAGNHDFSELEVVEDRGRRWALITNIAFGAAAVTAVITSVLYVRQREPQVIVGANGGASVGIAWQF